MTKDEMKDRISMALKDPVLQQGFEIICKENAELKKQVSAMSKALVLNVSEADEKLVEAKNHIHRLLVLLTEGKRSYAVIDESRAFLQEVSE